MIKKLHLKFLLWIIALELLVFQTSCTVFSISFGPTQIPRSNWVNNWLNNPVCQTPCWENITPGLTTILEAKEKLNSISIVNNIHGPSKGPLGTELSWQFENENDAGTINAYPDNLEIVSWIFLYPQGEPRLSLGEINDKLGFPDTVHVYDCRDSKCMIRIIYFKNGLYIETLLPNNNKQVNITSEIPIDFVWLIEPGKESFIKSIGEGSLQYINQYPWQGYGIYKSP